ncbi:TspO/MBR family protein [Kroppenstedtia eburnea]|uniref:TspO and MBR related proteins n=1 Tax=Kroppenstedtia eburnea TaxID=714067 RepID=A0A1N7LMT7_9BACL|nr:TspO/MBR family protein [Kroppenstedtia eburnea]QKI81251.1 tryptophan-rich sensory protein [Kroppenstedtia eburnea]SIS75136.1 TspO and MBR related proteins [Kroppenstedtia eburnea]
MRRKWVSLIIFFMVSFGVFGLGAAITDLGPGTWYDQLQKPWFHPPQGAFRPVWLLLHFLIVVSGWRVWLQRDTAERRYALLFWMIQLALLLLWVWLFFSHHLIGGALLESLVLWFFIGSFVIAAWRVDRAASVLFLPYWFWISFTALLNLGIWWRN